MKCSLLRLHNDQGIVLIRLPCAKCHVYLVTVLLTRATYHYCTCT